MKKALLLVLTILNYSFLIGQDKTLFERNGVVINFQTTKLAIIVNNDIEIKRDLGFSGDFIFIPNKSSVVIRHSNGNDELLKVTKVMKTFENNYIFECDKNRVLFISPDKKVITYSIEGNSSIFLFQLSLKDADLLKSVIKKY